VRMRMQEERERRERLATIGRIASTIVHDLRSPLTVVSGYLDVLETKSVPEEQRQRMARQVRNAVNRIGNLVREVLEFAREQILIVREPVVAAELLADVAEEVAPELERAHVRLLTRIECEGTVDLDPDRMRRVLLNLISNAVGAMAADGGGTLTLGCERTPGGVVLEVADSGPGIPLELRPRLFLPFATFGKKDGTGLGLSIAQSIVTAHGGSIQVEDATPRGTRFLVRLER